MVASSTEDISCSQLIPTESPTQEKITDNTQKTIIVCTFEVTDGIIHWMQQCGASSWTHNPEFMRKIPGGALASTERARANAHGLPSLLSFRSGHTESGFGRG